MTDDKAITGSPIEGTDMTETKMSIHESAIRLNQCAYVLAAAANAAAPRNAGDNDHAAVDPDAAPELVWLILKLVPNVADIARSVGVEVEYEPQLDEVFLPDFQCWHWASDERPYCRLCDGNPAGDDGLCLLCKRFASEGTQTTPALAGE